MRAWRLLLYAYYMPHDYRLLRAGVEASIVGAIFGFFLVAAPCGRGGFRVGQIVQIFGIGCSARVWRLL